MTSSHQTVQPFICMSNEPFLIDKEKKTQIWLHRWLRRFRQYGQVSTFRIGLFDSSHMVKKLRGGRQLQVQEFVMLENFLVGFMYLRCCFVCLMDTAVHLSV